MNSREAVMYFSYRLMTYEKTLRREIEDLKETLVSKSEILELKEMIKMLVKQKS